MVDTACAPLLVPMFNCRVCANTPFGTLFGGGDDASSETSSMPSVDSSSRSSASDRRVYSPRSAQDVEVKKAAWKPFVHPRTKDLWGDRLEAEINRVLIHVASNIDRREDPVMGDDAKCVLWHGDFGPLDHQPVMNMLKLDQEIETHVLRVLAFLFVDDTSFDALSKHTTGMGPLETVCLNSRCVNLRHVALPE